MLDVQLEGYKDSLELSPSYVVELIIVDENDLLAWSGVWVGPILRVVRASNSESTNLEQGLEQGHWLS